MTKAKRACAAAVVVAAFFAPDMQNEHQPYRTVSKEGLERIVKSEGCMYCSYRDSVGVLTAGVGATRGLDGKRFREPVSLSDHDVALLLHRDIGLAEQCVTDKMNGWAMPQTVYDSMVDLVFNVGCAGSTYNEKRKAPTSITSLSIRGEWSGACAHLTDFVWAGGKRSAGLVNRRTDQKAYCLSYSE